MNRSRDISWPARLATIIGMIVFGAVLFGAQPSAAVPVAPVGPTDLAVPVAPPLPPKPCHTVLTCHPPTFQPCFVAPGATCAPPTSEPTTVTTKPPTLTPRPSTPTRTSTGQPTAVTPTAPPSAIPTPNRIDTGGGATAPEIPVWLFWVVPGFAVLMLGSGVAGWWMARSERSGR